MLDILLGDLPALPLSQKFYQRALCGDTHEISTGACRCPKRAPLAAHRDAVLLPAMQLANAELPVRAIGVAEQLKATISVIKALDGHRCWC